MRAEIRNTTRRTTLRLLLSWRKCTTNIRPRNFCDLLVQLVFPTFSIYDPFATDVNFTTCWCNRPLVCLIDSNMNTYSRNELLDIRTSVLASNVKLDQPIWKPIKQAGICNKPPTRRGSRAGRNRRIAVVFTQGRYAEPRPIHSTVNTNNLTRVNMKDNGNKLCLNVSLMNCQSMCNKTMEIADYVKDHNVDIVALTETWLKDTEQDNTQAIGDMTPDGYCFKHVARSGKKGGGVGLLFKKTLSLEVTKVTTKSFECMDACLTSGAVSLRIIVVYRLHPKYKKNGINSNLFFDEFTEL